MGQRCLNSAKANTQSSDPQVHCLEEYSRTKVVENYQYTSALMRGTNETVCRAIISVNQLSIYGEVSDLCDECKSCHVRTGRLVLVNNLTHCLRPLV